MIGNHWHADVNFERRIMEYTFDSDHWKLKIQDGLAVDVGKPGSVEFYRSPNGNEHNKLSRHLIAETCREVWVPGDGYKKVWTQHSKFNHWLDCCAMCGAAGDLAGFRLTDCEVSMPDPKKESWYANYV